MAALEALGVGLAVNLATETLKFASKKAKEAWKMPALQRAYVAGVSFLGSHINVQFKKENAAVINAAFTEFFNTPSVHSSFKHLLNGKPLDRAELEEYFGEILEGEPEGFDFGFLIGLFEYGFCEAATYDPDLQQAIQANQLMAQTELIREQTSIQFGQRQLLADIHTAIIGLADLLRENQNAQIGIQINGDLHAENVVNGTQILKFSELKAVAKVSPNRKAYLEWVLKRDSKLLLDGIDLAAAANPEQEFKLDAIYTPLQTQSFDPKEKAEHQFVRALHEEKEYLSAVQVLNREKCLVVLGDPGGGKSTLVNHITESMAGELLDRPEANLTIMRTPIQSDKETESELEEWDHDALTPVKVILRDFAVYVSEGSEPDLWAFIQSDLIKHGKVDYLPEFTRELNGGSAVLMLDGLDEVPESDHHRDKIVTSIKSLVEQFPGCRVLVTSRTYAYEDARWHIPGFKSVILAPFNDQQIEFFIRHWYQAVATTKAYDDDTRDSRIALLLHGIRTNDKVGELAQRPILLTLMASLHAWDNGELPDNRHELYEKVLDLLLNKWEGPKTKKVDGEIKIEEPALSEYLKTDKKKLRSSLEKLAFNAHQSQVDSRGTADIAYDDLSGEMMRLCDGCKEHIDPKRLRDYLEHRAGILAARSEEVYTFPHRSFQEYLAACHCCQQSNPPKFISGLVKGDPEKWREVALLAAARMGGTETDRPWAVMDNLFTEDDARKRKLTTSYCWQARIAAQVIREACDPAAPGPANKGKLDRVSKALTKVLSYSAFPTLERVAAGRLLASFGDPRKSVTTLDAMEFCFVPQGPFVMGSDESADEKPRFHNSVDYDYWMARFPVSVAQFTAYVSEASVELGDDDALKGGSNTPVVWISHDEAQAFCTWLTNRWHVSGKLPKTLRVGLPSEAEWEKASRGGLDIPVKAVIGQALDACEIERLENEFPAREYPWGEEADSNRMNCNETKVNSVSAVGCFSGGASVYGCEEMSGNVWEWCRTPWQENYETYENEMTPQEDSSFVLRGGAFWNGSPLSTRCSFRCGFRPDDRHFNIGFRVCVFPFSTSEGCDSDL